jgi:serine/threonine protein phosphatase PrpC
MQIVGAMRTDPGLVREVNEDAVAWITPQDETAAKGSLAIVADGMGGHAAGEVASALAIEVIQRVYYELNSAVPKVLQKAFAAANRAILTYAEQHPECRGMGTTCTVLAFRDRKAWLGHIGDSRAYLLRKGELRQLSEDQTLVAQLVSEGTITPEEADLSPVQNVILQALGAKAQIEPIIASAGLVLEAGDILVLCSDGLFNMVEEPTIADLAGRLPPQEACDALIEAALAAGGHDNASLGIFIVNAEAEVKKPLEPTTRRITLPIEQRR